jgi:hypothetical protein
VPPFIEVGDVRKKGSGGSTGGHVEAMMEGGPRPVIGRRRARIPIAAGGGGIMRLVAIRIGEGGG